MTRVQFSKDSNPLVKILEGLVLDSSLQYEDPGLVPWPKHQLVTRIRLESSTKMTRVNKLQFFVAKPHLRI